jgi:hypothetical protein
MSNDLKYRVELELKDNASLQAKQGIQGIHNATMGLRQIARGDFSGGIRSLINSIQGIPQSIRAALGSAGLVISTAIASWQIGKKIGEVLKIERGIMALTGITDQSSIAAGNLRRELEAVASVRVEELTSKMAKLTAQTNAAVASISKVVGRDLRVEMAGQSVGVAAGTADPVANAQRVRSFEAASITDRRSALEQEKSTLQRAMYEARNLADAQKQGAQEAAARGDFSGYNEMMGQVGVYRRAFSDGNTRVSQIDEALRDIAVEEIESAAKADAVKAGQLRSDTVSASREEMYQINRRTDSGSVDSLTKAQQDAAAALESAPEEMKKEWIRMIDSIVDRIATLTKSEAEKTAAEREAIAQRNQAAAQTLDQARADRGLAKAEDMARKLMEKNPEAGIAGLRQVQGVYAARAKDAAGQMAKASPEEQVRLQREQWAAEDQAARIGADISARSPAAAPGRRLAGRAAWRGMLNARAAGEPMSGLRAWGAGERWGDSAPSGMGSINSMGGWRHSPLRESPLRNRAQDPQEVMVKKQEDGNKILGEIKALLEPVRK